MELRDVFNLYLEKAIAALALLPILRLIFASGASLLFNDRPAIGRIRHAAICLSRSDVDLLTLYL